MDSNQRDSKCQWRPRFIAKMLKNGMHFFMTSFSFLLGSRGSTADYLLPTSFHNWAIIIIIIPNGASNLSHVIFERIYGEVLIFFGHTTLSLLCREVILLDWDVKERPDTYLNTNHVLSVAQGTCSVVVLYSWRKERVATWKNRRYFYKAFLKLILFYNYGT